MGVEKATKMTNGVTLSLLPLLLGTVLVEGWVVRRRGGAPVPVPSRRSSAAVSSAAAASSDLLEVDVAVVGGGPAGYAMAALMADTHGHAVALVDPNPDALWPNNYGESKDEWETLSRRLAMPELLDDCVLHEWQVTDCFFGGSYGTPWDDRTRLQRPLPTARWRPSRRGCKWAPRVQAGVRA